MRESLFVTVSISNGVGSPAEDTKGPLFCPCLAAGSACTGASLCTDEGEDSWCCAPPMGGARRLVEALKPAPEGNFHCG